MWQRRFPYSETRPFAIWLFSWPDCAPSTMTALHVCLYKVWYLLEEELLIIPIEFVREQVHSSQPSLWVVLVLLKHRAWSMDGLKQGTVVSYWGPAEICQCMYLCLVTLSAALADAQWEMTFPSFFLSWLDAGIENKRLEQGYISSLPASTMHPQHALWKLSFQNLCRLGCSRNRKKETVWRKRLLHPGTASEVYKDNSLGDYGLQDHMKCVKSWWIQCV